MTNEAYIKLLDWGGWVVSNVVIGALFPLAAMAFMHLLKKILRAPLGISYVAPFRDGQLGFVCVGWVVAALVELVKYSVTHSGTSVFFYTAVLLVLAFVAATVAAAGAVSPVIPPATAPTSWQQWVFDTYPAFSASLALCVITLPLTAFVHAVTN